MPYAAKDRQEFIKRTGLNSDSCILDFGGMLSGELLSSVSGITIRRHMTNAVLIKSVYLPFKNSVFDAVVSYHYFDLISPGMLSSVFSEIARTLKTGSIFSFMILQWTAHNESQRSSLLFNELLKNSNVLFQHELEEVSRLLETSGFREITLESIKRDTIIPRDFIRSHLLMLGDLMKKEDGCTVIKTLARQYFVQANEYGEAMLPAVHFTARR